MMSQNRQAAKDRDEAEHDYEVNRDALERLERLESQQERLYELLATQTGLFGQLDQEASAIKRPRGSP